MRFRAALPDDPDNREHYMDEWHRRKRNEAIQTVLLLLALVLVAAGVLGLLGYALLLLWRALVGA